LIEFTVASNDPPLTPRPSLSTRTHARTNDPTQDGEQLTTYGTAPKERTDGIVSPWPLATITGEQVARLLCWWRQPRTVNPWNVACFPSATPLFRSPGALASLALRFTPATTPGAF